MPTPLSRIDLLQLVLELRLAAHSTANLPERGSPGSPRRMTADLAIRAADALVALGEMDDADNENLREENLREPRRARMPCAGAPGSPR